MKNAIMYYYNLEPKEIHRTNDTYRFTYNSKRYILCPYIKNINELYEIYEISLYLNIIGIYCHKIIPNKKEDIITKINNLNYVLLENNIINRNISEEDIKKYTSIRIDINKYKHLKRNNWYELWINKIDYMEYQVTQFGKKYKELKESSTYFFGIVENCITMLSQTANMWDELTISHNRISKNTTTEYFYNPLNFVLDSAERDIGEYIKSYICDENIIQQVNKIINYIIPGEIRYDILFIRILYPSYYMDLFEKIIAEGFEDRELLKKIKNLNNYEKSIKKIYNYFRSILKIPEIQWLEDQ